MKLSHGTKKCEVNWIKRFGSEMQEMRNQKLEIRILNAHIPFPTSHITFWDQTIEFCPKKWEMRFKRGFSRLKCSPQDAVDVGCISGEGRMNHVGHFERPLPFSSAHFYGSKRCDIHLDQHFYHFHVLLRDRWHINRNGSTNWYIPPRRAMRVCGMKKVYSQVLRN